MSFKKESRIRFMDLRRTYLCEMWLLLFILLPVRLLAQNDNTIRIDREEALKAYELLNEIRAYPDNYCKVLHFNKGLHTQHTALTWNNTLAKAAEAKAYDMAKRDYFGHVNPDGYGMNYLINKAGYKLIPEWLEDKRSNNFESIGIGVENGEAAIRDFIIDAGVSSLGHRKHLLGLGEWNASLVDIGIGYVRRCSGNDPDDCETYICVLIAKHDW